MTDYQANTHTFMWNGQKIKLKPMRQEPSFSSTPSSTTNPHVLTMHKFEESKGKDMKLEEEREE